MSTNAIADCAKRGVNCANSIANLPLSLYNMCKNSFASGIKEIKYINDYQNDELAIFW